MIFTLFCRSICRSIQRTRNFFEAYVIVLCLEASIHAPSGIAQGTAPFPSTFQEYSVEQGLSQSSVFASIQDHFGFMWFGTQDGLNRFDGYSFRIYRAHLSDTTALVGNAIEAFYEGQPSGRLWVRTSNGLCLYNRAQENFIRVPLPKSRINALVEDNRGILWIATEQAVFRYNTAERRLESCFAKAASSLAKDSTGTIWIGTKQGLFFCSNPQGAPILIQKHSAPLLSTAEIFTMIAQRDALWIATAQGLAQFRGNATLANAPLGNATLTMHHPEESLPTELRTNTRVRELRFDRSGCLWVRYPSAVVRFDVASGTFRTFSHQSEAASQLSSSVISCLSEDAHGRMWIGTTNGLYLYANNRLDAIPVESSRENGLQEGLIRSLYADRTGTMWIGLNVGGVQLWHQSRQKFTTVQHREHETNGQTLVGASVRTFANGSKPDEYWIATETGLSYWARQTNTWKTYRTNEKRGQPNTTTTKTATKTATKASSNETSTLPFSQLRALYRAPNGILWIGTYGGGLVSFNPATERFTTYFYHPADTRGIASEQVRAIFPDTARNLLFLGHYRSDVGTAPFNGGITVWQTQLASTVPFQPAQQRAVQHYAAAASGTSPAAAAQPTSSSNTLSVGEVRSFHRDAAGRLWIGTHGGGLNCLDERTGTIRHFFSSGKDSSELSGNSITSICDADSGKLWVATTFGLNKFDPERGTATHFTMRDGLPNDFIYGILPDAHGNLWLSTNHGLSRFSPSTKTFRNYDAEDGLQSDEFNSGAYFLNAAGEMMFGGVHGFNIFHPDSIPNCSPQVIVRLTDFFVMDVPARLDSALQEYRQISLPYWQNTFSMEFSALEYSNIRKLRYAYKLVGVDKNWVFSGTRRFASYSELEPGTYQFYAQASHEDGSFALDTAPMLLHIVITPPFWKTWWFRCGLGVTFLGTLWGAYKRRIRVIEQQKRELERLVQQRTKELESTNIELQSASEEITRQNDVLQEQTVHVELSNTELAEANALLATMNTRLQSLNQRKNELVGMVAHDLRNPLTSIVMSAELIARAFDRMPREKVIEIALKTKSAAERMNAIIGDVLNVEAIEAGTLQFRIETVNGSRLTASIVEEYRLRAAEKGIVLNFESSTPDVMLSVDERATYQVVENIVSNAIKYSPFNSRVWIRIQVEDTHAEGSQEASKYALFSVRDEGPGLSDDDQKKLFGRFTRLTPRPTGNEPSTGLGLSIVKEFVEAMNGQISCKSSLGAGSEFIVVLPLAHSR